MTERQRARAEFAKRKMIEIGERAEREERQKAIFSALNLTREQVAAGEKTIRRQLCVGIDVVTFSRRAV